MKLQMPAGPVATYMAGKLEVLAADTGQWKRSEILPGAPIALTVTFHWKAKP